MESRRSGPRLSEREEAVRLGGHSCAERTCAWPGCFCDGQYRAPVSRDHLRDYIWLCLEHIRLYNGQWDYFAGMSADEIDAHRRADTTWHRPSWAFGAWQAASDGRVNDRFGVFGRQGQGRAHSSAGQNGETFRPNGQAGDMISIMGLEIGFTLEELKVAYKTLAKRYHPDLNGGDRTAEEALKRVIEAYTYLRDHRLYA